MAKPRKQRDKDETASSVKDMVKALKFCALAGQKVGNPSQTHIRIFSGRAIAFDGTLAAGTMIQAEVNACPHLTRLIAALSKCGEQVSIAQMDAERLQIRSDRLKAIVPCIDPATVPEIWPDPPALAVDARMGRALDIAGQLANDLSPDVVTAAVLLTSLYAFGTNRHVMYRANHGIELPGSLIVPKLAIKALKSSGKDLDKIGASATSVTFWFTDGSWLRSQLYAEGWPEEQAKAMFAVKSTPTPFPEKFFEGLEAISPFCENQNCFTGNGGIRSHRDESIGAKYDISELPDDRCYNPDYLLALEDIADRIDFYADKEKVYFSGENVDGILIGKRL